MATKSLLKVLRQSLLIALCCAAVCYVHAATVVHYRFEGGGEPLEITDSGPNHINGTDEGSTPLYLTSDVAPYPAAGQWALGMAGDSNFGRIPHHPAFELSGSFTIEFFVRVWRAQENYGGVGPRLRHTILCKKLSTEEGAENAFSFVYEPLIGEVLITTQRTPGGMRCYVDLRDDRWHHVAWVISHTEGWFSSALYVDGEYDCYLGTSSPMTFDWGTGPWCIGANNFANDAERGNFQGVIDEIRVSDAALGPADFVTDLSPKPLAATIAAKVEITWPSRRHDLYQVEWASELDTNTWQSLGGSVYGNGFINVVYDDMPNSPARFYRVRFIE